MKPTTSTSRTFGTVEGLPSYLIQAVKIFEPEAKRYKLRDPEFASGMCLEMSAEFYEVLLGLKVKRARIREYIFDPDGDREVARKLMDRWLPYFPFDSSGCRFHFVTKVDRIVIDWTARQFDPIAPVPAIWRER